MSIFDELRSEIEPILNKYAKAGLQIFYAASGGKGSIGGMVNDDKGFICPHTILCHIVSAPRNYWGRMCRLSLDIAHPSTWTSDELDKSRAASIETPERCAQLQCQRCDLHSDKS